MTYDVRLETVPPGQPLMVVRRRAMVQELPKVIPEACGAVWKVVRQLGLQGAGRHVALYRDCVVRQFNLEIGVEVDAPFAGHGEVVGSALPSGTVATVTHLGPYGKLKAAHEAVHDWCAANGHKLAGPSWEIYGHWEDAWNQDPSKIRTDIYYLLANP